MISINSYIVRCIGQLYLSYRPANVVSVKYDPTNSDDKFGLTRRTYSIIKFLFLILLRLESALQPMYGYTYRAHPADMLLGTLRNPSRCVSYYLLIKFLFVNYRSNWLARPESKFARLSDLSISCFARFTVRFFQQQSSIHPTLETQRRAPFVILGLFIVASWRIGV
jgi:hypothetical protein